MTIPNIPVVGGEGIPFIQVNGTDVKLIQTIRPSNIGVSYISDARVWMTEPSQAIPPTVPVTVLAGTPIVNMPGCVKVHKENVSRDQEIRCWLMMTLKVIQYYAMLVLLIMIQQSMIIED